MPHYKPDQSLQSKIIEAYASQQEYLGWRHLYSAILDDQMLELSPNYELIMQRIVELGKQAVERARDARMILMSVLDFEIESGDEIRE